MGSQQRPTNTKSRSKNDWWTPGSWQYLSQKEAIHQSRPRNEGSQFWYWWAFCPFLCKDRDIREYFATFGAIKEAFVSLEKDTTISRRVAPALAAPSSCARRFIAVQRLPL